MPIPAVVSELIERFERNREAYRSGQYNETQVRREFIDPMFKALGWDMDNEQGYAEAYKDVVHEDAIKVGGATKAPDYSFRIGGTRKFFLEAKKPAVNIKEDIHPAYQLRRYAWSAKLPLSILSDFEELAVYDCRIKPDKADKAAAARTLYLTYRDYPQRWDELAAIFSRQAVLKGSFDRYAESNKAKKGTQEVDAAFLQEIERWRDLLARNIALRNPGLNQRDLNHAVQATIDRIIFLRICEDRGIEPPDRLRGLQNGGQVYERLGQLFRQADDRYNSGLFHFKPEKGRETPDEWTLSLQIDDRPLKDMLKNLYYPDSPYEFSVLPADILGQVYEQFLGKVIRLTPGHRAIVEDKPEVKKAGGVYYTPTYIVDYIVRQTVGQLLGDKGVGSRVEGLGPASQPPNPRPDTLNPASIREEFTHDSENLPRIDSLAEGHGPGGSGLPADPGLSGRGEVWPDQPTAPGSSVNPSEHRRGLRTDPSGGLSASSLNRQRLAAGSGDTPDYQRPVEVRHPRKSRRVVAPVPTSRQDVEQTDRLAAIGSGVEGLGSGVEGLGFESQPPNPRPATPTPTPQTLKDIRNLRILDPACGSGSFLIGAYQYLLDWYLRWYTANEPEKWARKKNPPIYQTGLGGRVEGGGAGLQTPSPQPQTHSWQLTTSERKRILLEHIFGVDIDAQAVETTKLSLLLKVLEGESEQSLASQLSFFQERALPDLSRNIKCGNSLIGPDFYDTQAQQMSLFSLDEEERYRINVFDWQAEFPEIMRNGGFDAVIGNPPYGAFASIEQTNYYRQRYVISSTTYDSFALFMEQSSSLLRPGGILGMIVQSAWVSAPSMSSLRDLFASRFRPLAFASMPYDVFGAYIDTVVVVAERLLEGQTLRDLSQAIVQLAVFPPRFKIRSVNDFDHYAKTTDAIKWLKESHNEFLITISDKENTIIDKLHASGGRFADIADIQRGVTPFHPSSEKPQVNGFPAFTGTVRRYTLTHSEQGYIRYDDTLAEYKPPRYFNGPRLLLRELISRQFQLQAVYTNENYITNKSMQSLLLSASDYHIFYLLGLLNSRLLSWYFLSSHSVGRRDDFPKIVLKQTRELPFRKIDFTNPADKASHDHMVALVEQMLALHQQLAAAKSAHDKTALQRQIAATDRQIDRLVYALYHLSEEEIRLVEGRGE